jgi:hypothetical protein
MHPEWSGSVIEHDPVYVGHPSLPSITSNNFQWIPLGVAIVVLIILMGAIFCLRKKRSS